MQFDTFYVLYMIYKISLYKKLFLIRVIVKNKLVRRGNLERKFLKKCMQKCKKCIQKVTK